jgi:hypothetical protein
MAFILLSGALSGCFKTSADELYVLPRTSREYQQLQDQIDAVLAAGAELSAPTGGDNRASVQLVDLDGNGEKEVIAFFIAPGDNPLKIYVFRDSDGNYEVADIIDGVGAGFESVRYADMNGDGTMELIVGRQVSPALRQLTLYSMRGLSHTKLVETSYSVVALADMDGDSFPDVIAVRTGSSETPGEAEVFSLRGTGEIVSSLAHLSSGLDSINRIQSGKLSDGAPALFVDSKAAGGSVVTDIFAVVGESLVNLSLGLSSDIALSTLRSLPVFSADINRDGVIEVPSPRLLPQQSDTKYYIYDWFAYDSRGVRTLALSTFQDDPDGWYLILKPSWRSTITVRLENTVNGERAMVFSYRNINSGETGDFLKLYTLSGDNRDDREKLPNRFRLFKDWDVIYAAELLDPGPNFTSDLTEDDVRAAFARIITDITF